MVNIRQFEYGVIGVLLANPNLIDATGLLSAALVKDSNIRTITIALPSAPTTLKGGVWLTGNA